MRINVSCIGSVMLPSFQEASPWHLPCNVWCSLETRKGYCILNQNVISTIVNLTARGWGEAYWISHRQAQRLILEMVKMVCKYVLFLRSGILRKRGGQLLNVGLKISQSASVSGQRSQWTDLSPRQAGPEGEDEVGGAGGVTENKGKRTLGNLWSTFWLWDKTQLCKNGLLWRSLCISYNNNSWILT